MKIIWKIKKQKDVERGEEYVKKVEEKYKVTSVERFKDKIVINHDGSI